MLKEKFQAEATVASLAETANTRTSLKTKLQIEDEALRAAESGSKALRTEHDRLKADATDSQKRAECATAEEIEAATSAASAEARAIAACTGKCPPAVCM